MYEFLTYFAPHRKNHTLLFFAYWYLPSRAPPPSTVARKEVGNQAYPQFCSAGISPTPIRLQYLITPTLWILHTLDLLRGVANTHLFISIRDTIVLTGQNKTVDIGLIPEKEVGGARLIPIPSFFCTPIYGVVFLAIPYKCTQLT